MIIAEEKRGFTLTSFVIFLLKYSRQAIRRRVAESAQVELLTTL